MADLARHSGYGVSVNGSMVPGIVEGSVSLDPQLAKAILYNDSEFTPSFGGLITNAPVLKFRTRKVTQMSAPAKITANVIFYMRAYADDGSLGVGYISVTIANGLVVPISLKGQAGQAGELEIAVYAISSDGDTSPIAIGTSSPTLPVHGDAWTVGDVTISTAVAGIQQLNLNFGLEVKTNAGENGKPYPTLAWIDKQEATVEVITGAVSEATAARINTTQSLAAGTRSFVWRKLQEGAIPTGTGARTMTITKCVVEVQNLTSGRPSVLRLLVTPILPSAGGTYMTIT
jgi:hypothetical protein